MNDVFIDSIIVAIIQGLTEWFPISSSGHLVLAQKWLNFQPGLMFDVALHFGTLAAVFVYFGNDIINIVRDLTLRRFNTEDGKMGIMLIIGTIPIAFVGFFFKKYFEMSFENLTIIGIGFLITGIFLIITSLDSKKIRIGKEKNFGYKSSFFVGCAQALALFPGISRSGATIGAGILLGLNEKTAMKFSFLLSIPAIFGASILEIGNKKLPPELIWATLTSFIVGIITIHILLKIVSNSRKNLKWFGVYALLIGIAVLIWQFFSIFF